ncbi:MAG: arylsulfatase [Faecalibacterium sp.]
MATKKQPNVIFVLTDDQGYGELGCTGNPWIQTPCIDAFHAESAHFTDYHVSPLCAPSRGGLMSGRSPLRNGVWATCWGRSILSRAEYTLANLFEDNGYATGMFGKWHLGDNYPYRPQDRGFQRVVAHKGGGVGQTPDFWGNNYFDDTYFANGEPTKYDGYCTDVWFDCAKQFIREQHAAGDKPFFAYIATNAPHSPYLVEEKYSKKYEGNPDIVEPAFYGMIENIDENFGALRTMLQTLGIEDDTILIFMTDNGSSGCGTFDENEHLVRGYNAGMRGKKVSNYEGGHRVPFFIRYANGNLTQGDIDGLAIHLDFIPTLAEVCGLPLPERFHGDGISLGGALLRGEAIPTDRVAFQQLHQWTHTPPKWENAVMKNRWRLINGVELYDLSTDPSQKQDVSADYPAVVAELRAAHEAWWAEVDPEMHKYNALLLGDLHENPTRLDSMDVLGDVAWNQNHVAAAVQSCGIWAVEYAAAGKYRFTISRWPEELEGFIAQGLPDERVKEPAPYQHLAKKAIEVASVQLMVNGKLYTASADGMQGSVVVDIPGSGEDTLKAKLICSDGTVYGAFYVYVERLNAQV